MSKNISKTIAKRILQVETQTFDELNLTKLRADYQKYFWDIHTLLDEKDTDVVDLVKMDGLVDNMIYFAARKAYYAGLQDGVKIGGVV